MPGMNSNRCKRPDNGASGKGLLHSRLAQRAIAIVGALALAFFGLTAAVVYADGADFGDLTSDPVGTIARAYQNALGLGRAAGDEDPVVDNPTLDDWQKYMEDSIKTQGTANVGRIWTDKSVFTDSIRLSPSDIPITKAESSDFLVALSALSSTSNKQTYTDKPLDIVLVLDLSASMNDPIGYTEVYSDDLDTDNTYYIQVDGDYQAIQYSRRNRSWGYSGDWGRWNQVTPKSSASSRGTQVYAAEQAKLAALKSAVDQFISSTDEENDSMPADAKHRISIVTFSESARTAVGLTDCDGLGATTLTNTVNGLTATGGTRADLGLEQAQDVLSGNASRDNAQKVVVFFTDGQPGYYQFEDALAGDAVNTARDMKADEVTIFSVGVFDGASNAPVTGSTSDFNRYMNAVSSNYKDATCPVEYMSWWSGYDWGGNPTYTRGNYGNFAKVNLGPRTTGEDGQDDPQYYYTAESSSGLNDVFGQIAQDMKPTSVGVPTEVKGGFDMAHSGYITFTDTLGAYMEVDPKQSFTVVYKDTPYKATYDPDSNTYTLPSTEVDGNYTDDSGTNQSNINQVLITVTKSDNPSAHGDTVTVQVPASLIPLLRYNVDTKDGNTTITTDSTDAYPIRALYGVKLVDNIDDIMVNQLADEDSDLSNYLKQNGNKSADGTKAYFYSNNWVRPATADGTTAAGSTTATFEPSQKNAFYYFQEDTPVYRNQECTEPATADDLQNSEGNLYYKFTYDKENTSADESWELVTVPKSNFSNNPGYYGINSAANPSTNTEIQSGQLYIRDHAPRLSRVNEFDTDKNDTTITNTATQALLPSWTTNNQISVALGNNGRIPVEMPGSLDISKTVVTPADFPTDDANYHKSVDFEFTIHVDGVTSADGAYTAAVVEDGKTTPVENGITFDDSGNAKYSLHDGQHLIIYGLDNGASYTVTETGQQGYTTTKSGDTGTIVANATQHADFTNTYKITTPATVTGADSLIGTKKINGRAWENDESYTFVLAQLQAGTTDDAGTVVGTAVVKGDPVKGEDSIDFNFDDLTFDTPGVYSYTIYENDAQSEIPAGVSTSRARYRVTITVTDNHNGTLKAETAIQQTRDDSGNTLNPWVTPDNGKANFVNTYQVGETEATIQADKNVTSAVGGSYTIENDAFQFELRPVGDTAETAPMPDDTEGEGANRVAKMTNTGTTALFGITYKNSDFPTGENTAEFWYELSEDATYNPVPGMAYSEETYYAKVTITRTTDDEQHAVIGYKVEYFTDLDGAQLAPNNQALFTNTFDPSDVTTGEDGAADVHGTKTVDGRSWNGDGYTFTIVQAEGHGDQDGVTMPQNTTATVADNDAQNPKTEGEPYPFDFEGITFSKVGTYYFTITETGTPDDAKGMEYDTHKTNVTVTVGVDAENGKLQITNVTYNNEGVTGASTTQAEYTNVYTASYDFGEGDNGGIQVVKNLTGRALRAGEFSFTVKGIDGTDTTADEANAMLDSGDRLFGNNANGTNRIFTGNGFEFNQDDAGKTFSFVVDELSTQDEITAASSRQTIRPGVTYDTASYRVDLAVVDNGDGTMHVVTTITPCNADGITTGEPIYTGNSDNEGYTIPTVTFNNSYTAMPATYDTTGSGLLTKAIDGRAWLETDSFEFTIAPDDTLDGNLAASAMPNPETVTLSGAGHPDTADGASVPFGFGTLTFNTPGTYVYKVTEAKGGTTENGLTYSNNVATLKFVVEDDPDTGSLKVTNSDIVTNGAFVNAYEASVNYAAAGGINIQKTVEGHALTADKFTFEGQVLDANGDPVEGATAEWKNPAPAEQGANTVTWNPIDEDWSFDQDDAGQPFTFTVTEKNDGAAGYTYDSAKYTVTVTPIDNTDGTMSVRTVVTKEGVDDPIFDETTSAANPAAAVLSFTNTYGADATTGDVAADVTATKTLTGRNMNEKEFSFEIVTRDANPDDGVAFTSTTVATGTNAAADDGKPGDVTFTGTGDAMTYTIAKLDQAVADGYATKTVDDTTGNATWTLNYTALEDTSQLPNKVSAKGDTSFNFTVTVSDDGSGKLTATVHDVPEGGFAFQNTYKPDSVTVGADGDAQITVQKTFTGRPGNEWLDSDSFTFTIVAETGGAPMPDPATVEVTSEDNKVDGVAGAYQAIFSNVDFTKDDLGGAMTKDFVYDITETSPADSGSGITKDGHTAQVTVTVTDDGSGQLKASVAYNNDDATTDADQAVDNAAAFTNTYNAGTGTLVGADYLKASKTLTGRDWLAGEQVNLVLAGAKGTPAPEDATETDEGWQYALTFDANEELSFPNIAYTASDLDGAASKTFEYTIFEDVASHTVKDGSEADIAQIHQGMDYSEASYTVTVTVADNNKGALTVTPAMVQTQNDNGDPVDNVAVDTNTAAFTNAFSADEDTIQLAATKDYSDPTGGHPITNDMFTFMVKPVGDEAATAPMDDNLVAEGTTGADRYIAAGVKVDAGETPTADFGTAHFNFDGHNHTFYYEVVEALNVDGTWKPVAQAITANESGAYVQDGVTYDPSTFTVKVEVTYDDHDGTSSAEMTIYKVSYDEVSKADADALDAMKVDGITFSNSYGTGGTTVDTGDATTTANFTKVIDGRDWLNTDSFQFTITPQDGAPAFEGAGDGGVKTVDVTDANAKVDKVTDADGQEVAVNGRSFNFGSVTFTDANMKGAQMVDGKLTKTFVYTVAEVQPQPADDAKIPGMTYDGHTATLTIKVVDNGDGTMTATPQVLNSVFTNTYSTSVDGAAFGGFQITKTLTGRDMTAGQFEFTVTPGSDEAAEKLGITDGSKTVASPAAEDGKTVTVGTFGLADGMTFTQADAGKTFVYEVSETKGGNKGYMNDDATYRVEVAVAHDPANATLTVTTTVFKGDEQVGEPIVVTNASTERATASAASVDFQNSYAASTDPGVGGTAATVSTTKTLVNRPLEAGEFTFQVTYAGGDKVVVKSDVTNAADGTVDFGSFEYDTASLAQMVAHGYATPGTNDDGKPMWTIQYTASELTNGLADVGVSASKASFDFTITVVDNGDGSLTATAELPEDAGFTNTYSSTSEGDDPSISMTPTGSKVIEAADGLNPNLEAYAGKFTFTLSSEDPNAPMPEETTATNDEQGNVTFGAIEFTLDDLNKALGTQDDAAEGDEGIDTQDVGGTPRKHTFTYKVTESGSAAGITNDPTTVREFSYTVHDDGKGHLTVTSDPANAPLFTFTNTYSVEPEESSPTGEGQLTITKTLAGRDMDENEFAFVLTAPDGTQYTATNAAAADGEAGAVTFAPITFTEPGTYEFTLEEQPGADNVGIEYDHDTYNITANVKDNGTGGLDVTWSANGLGGAKEINFQNTYEAAPASMGFGATKVLTGRDLEEGEFTFQITNEAGDALYAEATNDATGTVNFDPMAFKQAGEYHLWISEVLPEDDDAATDGIQSENVTYDESRYELVVTVKDNGKGQLQVTNVAMADGSEPAPVFQNTYTKPEEPAKPVLPGGDTLEQTGDTMPLLLGVATVAGVALVAGGLAVRRKRGE